jgi:hypothetical protein
VVPKDITGFGKISWKYNCIWYKVANRGMKIQICTNNKNAQDLRRF